MSHITVDRETFSLWLFEEEWCSPEFYNLVMETFDRAAADRRRAEQPSEDICSTCDGYGTIRTNDLTMPSVVPCPDCGGTNPLRNQREWLENAAALEEEYGMNDGRPWVGGTPGEDERDAEIRQILNWLDDCSEGEGCRGSMCSQFYTHVDPKPVEEWCRRCQRREKLIPVLRARLTEPIEWDNFTRAWTVGNPDNYDRAIADGPVFKQKGGAVFDSLAAARSAVADGRLPEEWGMGDLPGAVYEMLTRPEWIGSERDQTGARFLTHACPITRRALTTEQGASEPVNRLSKKRIADLETLAATMKREGRPVDAEKCYEGCYEIERLATLQLRADEMLREAADAMRSAPVGEQRETRDIHEAFSLMQDDLTEILRALDLGDHARPNSPHWIVQDEVLPAIRRLRSLLDGERVGAVICEQQWGGPACFVKLVVDADMDPREIGSPAILILPAAQTEP